MGIKTDRLRAIRRLISEKDIKSQDELQVLLEENGFTVTQATLSRDFKELGVLKVHDYTRGYIYRLPGDDTRVLTPAPGMVANEGVRSIEFSSSFAVIKTHPGFASAVATIIDHNANHEIVGTLAGDDTVLLIIREGCDRERVLSSVSSFISGIKTKLK